MSEVKFPIIKKWKKSGYKVVVNITSSSLRFYVETDDDRKIKLGHCSSGHHELWWALHSLSTQSRIPYPLLFKIECELCDFLRQLQQQTDLNNEVEGIESNE
jgi:hypothetical protein